MNKKVAIILINYKDYARKYLADCFNSLKKQDYQGEVKIFIVDNETSRDSFDYLTQIASEAEIIRNKNNDGFAKGNNDAIKEALDQSFDYVILFNMDTIIEPDCVRKMVEAAEGGGKKDLDSRFRGNDKEESGNDSKGGAREIGAVQARIMLWPEKEKINSVGNITHFLGFGYCEGYGKEYLTPYFPLLIRRGETSEGEWGEVNICYSSGAAVLFKAEVLRRVGLFDEEFWMYNEDQDLGWRIWLAGFKCVLAPEAVAYHKYEFSRSIKKNYWMDRNRIIAVFKNYHWLTLIFIFPAFIVMEFGLLLFALKGGWFKEKIDVYKYFFSLKNWRYIIKARKQVQALRRIKDFAIVKMFSGKIWYQEVDSLALRLANVIFDIYWRIVRMIIFW